MQLLDVFEKQDPDLEDVRLPHSSATLHVNVAQSLTEAVLNNEFSRV